MQSSQYDLSRWEYWDNGTESGLLIFKKYTSAGQIKMSLSTEVCLTDFLEG